MVHGRVGPKFLFLRDSMETATTIQAKTVSKLQWELWKWKDKAYTKHAGPLRLSNIPTAFKKVLPKKQHQQGSNKEAEKNPAILNQIAKCA